MKIIKSSSPGRCGIIGNPTDGYGGSLISCSIEERAYAEVKPSDSLRLVTQNDEKILGSRKEFVLLGDHFDIPKILLNYFSMQAEKVEIRYRSDIPFGSGLAGSSAMLSAIYGALSAWKGLSFGLHQTAEIIHNAERDLLKIQCGYQDHYMTVFGGINYIDFRGKEYYNENIYATVESLTAYISELPFILAQSGVVRNSGVVLRPIRQRWEQGDEQVIKGYARVTELARCGKKSLLNQDWGELGQLMNQNHAVQQELGASGEVNDRLIETARNAGAEGAKLAGAGGGGTIIALATKPDAVIKALLSAGAQKILCPKPVHGLTVEVDV